MPTGDDKYKQANKLDTIIHITQIIHYSEDDKDFGGDYYSIQLKDDTNKVIASFGDWYHDHGMQKVDGFIAGIEYATNKKVKLTTVELADGFTG